MLVVVHGGVLHALYHHAMGHVYSGRVANCSMHKLKIEGKRWAIISWNETAHLEKVGFLGQEAGTLSAASKGGVAGDRL